MKRARLPHSFPVCLPRCRQTPQGSTLPPAVLIRTSPFLTSPQASVWPLCLVTQVSVAPTSPSRILLCSLVCCHPMTLPICPGRGQLTEARVGGPTGRRGQCGWYFPFPSRLLEQRPLSVARACPCPAVSALLHCRTGRNVVRLPWQFREHILYSSQRLSLA